MASLDVTLLPARGSHPTLAVRVSGSPFAPSTNCTLHLVQTLPADIFADPYELALHHAAFAFDVWGQTNLELPVHAMSPEGQILLLNVTVPRGAELDELVVELPLHLRYGKPTSPGEDVRQYGYRRVDVPWPTAFWACPLSASHTQQSRMLPALPDDVAAKFNGHKMLNVVPPSTTHTEKLVETVEVPVGRTDDLLLVDSATGAVVLACFFYLAFVCWKAAGRMQEHTRRQRVKAQ